MISGLYVCAYWGSRLRKSQLYSVHKRILNGEGKIARVHATKACGGGGDGDVDPRVFDVGARWRWTVSFTPRPALYPEKDPSMPNV
jgi:hypothetical protein